MATVRQLVVMQTACQLSLLKMGSNVFVGHFLHACLQKVGFLDLSGAVEVDRETVGITSSSDHDRLPPADILRARRLDVEL
jgi:hypothetical protein